MSKQQAPLLSVGIIFRNEIRCLERCLESLQLLREQIPMELVMADTGSDDGSREVAERYADLLFDFPWIDDFSAAKNAVLDRCSADWVLFIDSDEWLDKDVSKLVRFLQSPGRDRFVGCALTVRNYTRADLTGDYGESMIPRMLRRSAGVRYEGAIHEHWNEASRGQKFGAIPGFLIHHDGYVVLNDGSEAGRRKRARNMALIERELEQRPDDLKLMVERFESCEQEDKEKNIRLALDGMERRLPEWKSWGPVILRYAVFLAYTEKLPELWDWVAQAREMFPDSPMTTIEIGSAAFAVRYEADDYPAAIVEGENFLRALAGFDVGDDPARLHVTGTMMQAAPSRVALLRCCLAESYLHEKRFHEAWNAVACLDGAGLEADTARKRLNVMLQLQSEGGMDLGAEMVSFWDGICAPKPSVEASAERQKQVSAAGLRAFSSNFLAGETAAGFRHAYTLFLPLEGKCMLGNMAAFLEETAPGKLTELLSQQKDYRDFPTELLFHALEHGATFPPPGKPMSMESLDALAVKLGEDKARLRSFVAGATPPADLQALDWQRALAMVAVRTANWKEAEDGLALAHAFAAVEQAYLPRCFTPEAMAEPCILSPMHRIGLCAVRAFDALDAGDAVGAVRALREGLESCPEMKPMTEFLLDEVQRREKQNAIEDAPPELQTLANQVRAILAAFPPDDPAVAQLKNSPAYQKVAYLIEG